MLYFKYRIDLCSFWNIKCFISNIKLNTCFIRLKFFCISGEPCDYKQGSTVIITVFAESKRIVMLSVAELKEVEDVWDRSSQIFC